MRRLYLNSLKTMLNRVSSENASFTLKEELQQLVTTLLERYNPDTIILAGSLAEGKWVRGLSDIDILIVTERARGMAHVNRFELRSIDGVDVNIAVYTMDEVIAGIKSLNFFVINAISSGVALYNDKVFEEIKALLKEEAEKLKLVKREGGWNFYSHER